jgi:ATP-binding cassette subfamily F protein uup
MHRVYIEKLSGGEKKRLQLLRVLLTQPNFLILDEPTNDLDIYVMNVLEQYLMLFPGTLIIVSHDRYFMDKLTNHLFVFEGNGLISDFPGNYSDYKNHLLIKEKNRRPAKTQPRAEKQKPQPDKKKKLSFKEQRELDRLEAEIEQLESEKDALLQKLNSGTDDHEQLTKWSQQFDSISKEIDDKTTRWMELSELM